MLFSRVGLCVLLATLSLGGPAVHAVNGGQKAWAILRSGVTSDNSRRRAAAIRSLGLIPGDVEARDLAVAALEDPDAASRAAAATAVGRLHVSAALPKLRTLLDDEDLGVVIAAAHALDAMKDDSAYDTYYAILTGERKGKGLVAQQLDTLRDPKKLATLGVGEAVGFVPFASIGWDAVRAMRIDDSSAVRAAAASMLAADPDPKSLEALKTATADKSWLVRIAALEALAKRKDPDLLGRIELSMYDSRSEVRYTAAALVVHLSDATPKQRRQLRKRP